MIKLTIFALLLAVTLPVLAQHTPTMGWRSWNTFALNINEGLIRQQAAAMHNSGLQEASRDWSKPQSLKIDIDLQQGNNVIRLWNDGVWLPDMDKMELD